MLLDMRQQRFEAVKTILVVDWPSREVPEGLARAGFQVVVHGGPGPEDYSAYELRNGQVVARWVGRPPEHAELIYSYRPLSELPGILAMAKSLQAKTVWTQSGVTAEGAKDPKGCWVPEPELRAARSLVESAGLHYFSEPYIGDVVHQVQAAL
jgi:predicted CoA-binding protein